MNERCHYCPAVAVVGATITDVAVWPEGEMTRMKMSEMEYRLCAADAAHLPPNANTWPLQNYPETSAAKPQDARAGKNPPASWESDR